MAYTKEFEAGTLAEVEDIVARLDRLMKGVLAAGDLRTEEGGTNVKKWVDSLSTEELIMTVAAGDAAKSFSEILRPLALARPDFDQVKTKIRREKAAMIMEAMRNA